MGQWWNVVSVDTRTRYEAGKLGKFLLEHSARNLVYLLAKNDKLLQNNPPVVYRGKPVINDQGQSHFLKLPDEILLQILEVSNKRTLLYLALTCCKLWHIGWEFLHQRTRRRWLAESWAGTRVIVLGEYCEPYDHPPSLLTEVEEELLENGLTQNDVDRAIEKGDLYEEYRDSMFGPASLYRLSQFAYRKTQHKRPKSLSGSPLIPSAYNKLPPGESRRLYLEFLRKPFPEWYLSAEVWILRNLMAKEFVRGGSLFNAFQEGSCPYGPDIGYPGFGEAVVSRACWSPDSSTTPVPGMNNGPWAGHRFEICCHSDHVSNSDESWKDVSRELAAELSLILGVKLQEGYEMEEANARAKFFGSNH